MARRRPFPRYSVLAAAAFLVIFGDMAASRAAQDGLTLGERIAVIPGVFVLTHVQNTGAAYGLLAGQRWLLVALAALIVPVLLLFARTARTTGRWVWAEPAFIGLILGGALSNLLERLVYGYVTDYLTVPPISLFRVFNLADVGINLGVAGLLFLALRGGPKEPTPVRRSR